LSYLKWLEDSLADKLKEQIAFDIASARRYLERLSNLKAHPAD